MTVRRKAEEGSTGGTVKQFRDEFGARSEQEERGELSCGHDVPKFSIRFR